MNVEAHALLGREQELPGVDRFVAAVEEGATALVLEGEAGIGKTSLFEHALQEASLRGYLILGARPTSPESTLSFVGRKDLLANVGEQFAVLPPPFSQPDR